MCLYIFVFVCLCVSCSIILDGKGYFFHFVKLCMMIAQLLSLAYNIKKKKLLYLYIYNNCNMLFSNTQLKQNRTPKHRIVNLLLPLCDSLRCGSKLSCLQACMWWFSSWVQVNGFIPLHFFLYQQLVILLSALDSVGQTPAVCHSVVVLCLLFSLRHQLIFSDEYQFSFGNKSGLVLVESPSSRFFLAYIPFSFSPSPILFLTVLIDPIHL